MVLRSKATRVLLVLAVAVTAVVVAITSETTAQTPPGPIFEPIAIGEADVVRKTSYRRGPTTFDLRRSIIPVGGIVPWHCHSGPATFIVVQGQLTSFAPDGSSVVLGPGDADVELVGVPRMSKNLGNEDVVVYITFASPKGRSTTIWLDGPNDKCRPKSTEAPGGHDSHGGHGDDTR